ncbi:DNA/RNA non-specific endonuclease [Mycobacteroides chelonae]|uniref:DNA/RNA non-specific endonuclease n=1 Tax=Mycobacteroides chelonae TaxID=1774 RepID=UPI001E4485BC|nr:DNA/RNA non-specific endonuclease [Mycobacteroides chelonae]
MTTLDEFMAVKPNAYMAVVDSWRPRTAALKANYDDYKRWATTPDGTYWSGQFAGAAQVAAADDCKGTDNADDTVEDIAKLAAATIEYEVLPPLTGGQNLIERVLQNADQGVSIDQNFNMSYTPPEGMSEETAAKNREHVKETERQIKESVAKWEKATQTLKTQTDAARETMLSRINPKAALVDGRKALRAAVAPKTAAAAADPAIDPKVAALVPGLDPGATKAAGALAQGSLPELLDAASKAKPPIDPKVGSLTDSMVRIDPTMAARQSHVEKIPGQALDPNSPAGKAAINGLRGMYQSQGLSPAQVEAKVQEALKAGGQDQYAVKFADPNAPSATPSEHVSRDFGEQFNKFTNGISDAATRTVDGQIEQGKILTGQAGPGAPGVAEAWKELGMNAAHQAHELTTDPLAAPKIGIEQAKDFINSPSEFIGKNIIHGTEALATGGIGGEAAAGARGLLGDLTGTEGRALTHGIEDAVPGHHSAPQVEHAAPGGDHTGGVHAPPSEINHVNAESGGPGGWNQELNKPAPNTLYNVDDRFHYNTDDQSRVGHAHADLDASSAADRNGYQQRIAGGPDRLPGDEGGHIFGSQFGGPGEAINITAMRDTLNSVGNREYYNLEGDWRTYIDEGKKVSVEVDISYPDNSRRPEMYSVRTYVDGNLDSVHSFRN